MRWSEFFSQTLKLSNSQTLKNSNSQTLKNSNSQTLKNSKPTMSSTVIDLTLEGNSYFNPIVLGDDDDGTEYITEEDLERERLAFYDEMAARAAQGLCTWDPETCIEGPPQYGYGGDGASQSPFLEDEDEDDDGAPRLINFDLAPPPLSPFVEFDSSRDFFALPMPPLEYTGMDDE
jgi:hypothetical protein